MAEMTSVVAAAAAHATTMEIARRAVHDATKATRFVATTYMNSKLNYEGITIGKHDASPVTVADFASQAIICQRLLESFPHDPIIGEEDSKELRNNSDLLNRVVQAVRVVVPAATGNDVCLWIDRGTHRKYTQRFWTLDPIDGTKGYLRRQQYAICLALVEDGIPTVGAMACPNLPLELNDDNGDDESSHRGTLFCAHLGGGAWQMPIPTPEEDSSKEDDADTTTSRRTRIQLLEEAFKSTNELRFCESVEAAHSNQSLSSTIASALNITRPPIRLDSQVKYGIIARGDADVYLRLPHHYSSKGRSSPQTYRENIWDHAAGHVLVTEAGGTVTDMNGLPLDFRHGAKLIKNQGVVASSGGPALQQHILAAIASSVINTTND